MIRKLKRKIKSKMKKAKFSNNKIIRSIYKIYCIYIIKVGLELKIGGLVLLKKILKENSEDAVYFCCPGGIGDTLILAGMMLDYKNEMNIDKITFIVRENHYDVAAFYTGRGIDKIIKISGGEMRCLRSYFVGMRKQNYKNIRYGQYMGNSNLTMIDRFSQEVLNLKFKCNITPPDVHFSEINVSDDSILLMPTANSIDVSAPYFMYFWNKLIETLKGHNYNNLYTNIDSEHQGCLNYTKPYDASIKELLEQSNNFLYIISVRSGICDVLSFSDCNLTVIDVSEINLRFWNIKELNDRDNIYNIILNKDNVDECIKEITDNIEAVKCRP